MLQPTIILQQEGFAASAFGPTLIAQATEALGRLKEHPATRRRLLYVVIESVQNIVRHGSMAGRPSTEHPFIFRLTAEPGGYTILSGNAIPSVDVDRLQRRIRAINGLNGEGLKDLYRSILQRTNAGQNGGAGLGFVDMARRSGKKLLCEFQEMSEDYCFFRMEVTVSRGNRPMSI